MACGVISFNIFLSWDCIVHISEPRERVTLLSVRIFSRRLSHQTHVRIHMSSNCIPLQFRARFISS